MKYPRESFRKVCESCARPVAFEFRKRILCSVCANGVVQKERNAAIAESRRVHDLEYQKRVALADMRKANPHMPYSPICELCGSGAEIRKELSDLCRRCFGAVEVCSHREWYNIEFFDYDRQRYIGTCRQCADCGLRYRAPDEWGGAM